MNPVCKSEQLKWERQYFILETFWYIMFLDSALKTSGFAQGPRPYSGDGHYMAAVRANSV